MSVRTEIAILHLEGADFLQYINYCIALLDYLNCLNRNIKLLFSIREFFTYNVLLFY